MSTELEYFITIGCSAGGIHALQKLLSAWPKDINAAVGIVQHISPNTSNLVSVFRSCSTWPVEEARDKQTMLPHHVYIAPADYHLLVERDYTLSLSSDQKVCFSRPSIDVLFSSAADAFRQRLIAVLLTGANHDGTEGLARVKKRGGHTLVQNPTEAEVSTMPLCAIEAGVVDDIVSLIEIGNHIQQLCNHGRAYHVSENTR